MQIIHSLYKFPTYRDARYFDRGRFLYHLEEVLANNHFRRFAGRSTSRRPIGHEGLWPRYALHSIYRNGHQKRLRKAQLKVMLTYARQRLRKERTRKETSALSPGQGSMDC